jgi:serine kinase of HPr protein (carbohydrate metabolism regulator)
MMDMICIVFVRGKKPTEEMVELAEECGIAVMCTDKRAFEASGILYAAGLSRSAEGKHA